MRVFQRYTRGLLIGFKLFIGLPSTSWASFATALLIMLLVTTLPLSAADAIKLTEWSRLSALQKTKLESLRNATFALDFQDGLQCTGTFISNAGHIITAEHCFRSCLRTALQRQRAVTPEELFSMKMRYHAPNNTTASSGYSAEDFEKMVTAHAATVEGSIQTLEYDIELYRGLECKAKINGKEELLTFVGGGRGELFPFFSDASPNSKLTGDILKLWQGKVSDGFGPGGDFGIWKASRTNAYCVGLSDKSTMPQEELYVLSQTCREGYSGGRRNGQMAFFSSGKEQSAELSIYREHLSITPYKHTTVESDNCSSGSAMIGEDGMIKGILTQHMSVLDRTVTPKLDFNFSSFIEASFIKDMIKNKWKSDGIYCSHP